MTDLVERLNQEALRVCHDAADRIKKLERDVNAIHHAMKEAGWHPGRTDDKLTDIIKAKGAEMARLERENAELRKDAERYRWLKEHNKSWSWQPSRYNHRITSGFAAYSTGYLGFDFELALDAAMKEQT